MLVLSGAALYTISILFFWRISGCEDGVEAYFLNLLGIKERLFGWMRL